MSGRPFTARPARLALVAALVAGLVAAWPAGLRAQGEPAAVRVLETVHPDTGWRSLHVLEGLSPEEIRAVQNALSRAGFGAAWRDGVLDPFTRGALQSFQTRRGLSVCACVSLETLIELGLRTRVAETVVLAPPARASAAEDDRGDRPSAEGAPSRSPFVDYGSYYPFGVVYLAPVVRLHHGAAHAVAVTRGGVDGFAGVRAGGLHVGAGMAAPAARPPLVPFGRVPLPANAVRGGR